MIVPGLACGVAGSCVAAGKTGARTGGTDVLLGLFMVAGGTALAAGTGPSGADIAPLAAGRAAGAGAASSLGAGRAAGADAGVAAGAGAEGAVGADAACLAAGVALGTGGAEAGLLVGLPAFLLICPPCSTGTLRPPEPASTKPVRTRLTTGWLAACSGDSSLERTSVRFSNGWIVGL